MPQNCGDFTLAFPLFMDISVYESSEIKRKIRGQINNLLILRVKHQLFCCQRKGGSLREDVLNLLFLPDSVVHQHYFEKFQ